MAAIISVKAAEIGEKAFPAAITAATALRDSRSALGPAIVMGAASESYDMAAIDPHRPFGYGPMGNKRDL